MKFGSQPILSIPEMLETQASAQPDATFLRFGDESFTYAAMTDQIRQAAMGLRALGVEPGGRVAFFMDNSPEMVVAWLGTATAGAVYVPVNTNFVGEYLRSHASAAEASVLFVDQCYLDLVESVVGDLDLVRHIVVRVTEPGPLPATLGKARVLAMDELLAAAGSYQPVPVALSDPNSIMFTSGTTGRSKGVVLSHHYLLRQAEQMWQSRRGAADDVVYTSFPLYHLNAMVLTVLGPLMGGATGALDSAFSVTNFWNRVRHYDATQINLMGSMMTMLWNRPARDDDADNKLRGCVAAPIPPDLRRPFEERFGVRFVTIYGMSEATPLALSAIDEPTPPGISSGRTNPQFDVRIFDADDTELEPGRVGEIVCRPLEAGIMFDGYFNNAEATVGAWRNLWFHTGDMGSIDEDGYLTFSGRLKDAIRRRGENVSAFELEEAIRLHPAVADVAVHAVPSEFSEDEIKACVVLVEGQALDFVELADFCVEHVPYFAVPRYIEILDELPRNQSNRVVKATLEERGVTADTWDREAAGYVLRRTKRS